MNPKTEKLAVLFADICRSTVLYERLGDDLASRLITRCIALMLAQVSEHNGTLIKTIGDEILCIFQTVEDATKAACAMQRALEKNNQVAEHPLHIRVGFHFGDVIREKDDIYGDTVNVAARVSSITRASQIMTTLVSVKNLPPEMRGKTHPIMQAELKGKQAQLDIARVIWEDDDLLRTHIRPVPLSKTEETESELTLRYNGQIVGINEKQRSAVLGRDGSCDILVINSFASRQHAIIELRFSKFVLLDQSTNGTYVRFADGSVVRLVRDEIVLVGLGSICLGQSFAEDPADVIAFSIASDTE